MTFKTFFSNATKKSAAAAAAGAVAISLVVTPTATAAPSNLGAIDELIGGATGAVLENMTCKQLGTVLKYADSQVEADIYNKSMTRSQLQGNLTKLSGSQLKSSPYLMLFTSKYAGLTADKAEKCNLVKPDPKLPGGLGALSEMSSKMTALAPVMEAMSSKA